MLYRSEVNRCNKPIISIALKGCVGAGEDGSDTTNLSRKSQSFVTFE